MDVNSTNEKQNEQVDLAFLWKIFRGAMLRILIVGVFCAGIAGAFRYFTTTPTYTSQMKFLVNGVSTRVDDGESVITPGSTTAARDLAETFSKVIESSLVVDDVIHLHLHDESQYGDKYKDITPEVLRQMVTVSVDAQVLVVSVTHQDNTIAHDVAVAFERVIPSKLDYLMGIKTASGEEDYESVAKCTDRAILDGSPSGRGSMTYAFFGFILGAVFIYLIAFCRAFFDNTVYTEEDLKPYFHIPVIGQIPTWNNENEEAAKKKGKKDKSSPSNYATASGVSSSSRDYTGRLLSKKTPFAISEAFKLLRTNMCYTTKGESCAVFGVTSAYVGAGKSILIANTAISFAQMGKKVLLLDGDLRCPVQHRVFNVDAKAHGLSEVLAGVCKDTSVAIRPSGIDNLDIVTSGRIPPNPAELLASVNMRTFIEEAKQTYDVIFIDLPPICEVSDAGVISDVVTGYAFVIRCAYSDRRLVALAVETMESLGSSIIGFVLNDVDIKSGDYYKNKYYGSYGKYKKYGKYGKYYSKYGKYSKYSKYGYRNKYGKYSKYGRYGQYGNYGKYGYNRQNEYRYGYTDEEITEQNLEKSDAPLNAENTNTENT